MGDLEAVGARDVLPVGVRRRRTLRDLWLPAVLSCELLAGVGAGMVWEEREALMRSLHLRADPLVPTVSAGTAGPSAPTAVVVVPPPVPAPPAPPPPLRTTPHDPFTVLAR